MRHRVLAAALMICLLKLLGPGSVWAKENETLRVGLYSKPGYHTVDEEGVHSGYDYEYLNRIAEDTGWEYEYVPGTWEECLDRLKSGEIDLLTGLEWTAEREREMAFPVVPTLLVSACLLQTEEAKPCAYEDFDAFEGKRIGTVSGSSMMAVLQEYSRAHGFQYENRPYDASGELLEALKAGEIDFACLASNQDLSAYRAVAYFGYTQLYYVLAPSRRDLLPELNDAIGQMNTRDRAFVDGLYEKYFNSPMNIAFTREELAYIERSAPIPVGIYLDMGALLCRYNGERQAYEGAVADALALLSERTGLRFSCEEVVGQTPRDYLAERIDTLAAPIMVNNLLNYESACGITFLDNIVKSSMTAVSRKEYEIDIDSALKLAMPLGTYGDGDAIRHFFPRAELLPVDSNQDAIGMVRDGKADLAVVSEIMGAYYLQSPYNRGLQMIRTSGISENMTFALNAESDPLLISILNKGIASMDERDIRQIVVNNTVAVPYRESAAEWLYEHKYTLILGTVICMGLIIALAGVIRHRKRRDEDRKTVQMAEVRHKADVAYQEELYRQANYDELTGLYNEQHFLERAEALLQEWPETEYAFLRINIRNFKMINDLYGTDVGDGVLREFADHLRRSVGPMGIYCRLYSDDFALCVDLNEAGWKQLKSGKVRYVEYAGRRIRVDFRIGVFINEQHLTDVIRALDYAQIALRKTTGTEKCTVFQMKDLEQLRSSQWITNEMEQALKEGQFKIYLQPQIDLKTNRLVGAEALARWVHPQRGSISPGEFIPVFEGNGFITRLDAWACEQVCQQLAEWKKRGKLIPVSVNLSRFDLQNPELITGLQALIAKYDVPVQYLHLEITETIYVEDMDNSSHMIEALRKLGFCVEMDDFGSGYSSLNMLKDVPVDVLKMDMRFFNGETHMDKGSTIIEAVVQMAHALGMLVVAEGVETQREANFLRAVHCNIVQGYLCGRPMPVSDFERMMAESKIGSKCIDLNEEIDGQYWQTEKYDVLLRSNGTLLLDYDPISDCAVLTFMDELGKRQNNIVDRYVASMAENQRVYPGDREKMVRALCNAASKTEEMELRADLDRTGKFVRTNVQFYHYLCGDRLNRTIAVLRSKEV